MFELHWKNAIARELMKRCFKWKLHIVAKFLRLRRSNGAGIVKKKPYIFVAGTPHIAHRNVNTITGELIANIVGDARVEKMKDLLVPRIRNLPRLPTRMVTLPVELLLLFLIYIYLFLLYLPCRTMRSHDKMEMF